MSKKLKIQLDEKAHQKLIDRLRRDKNGLRKFSTDILTQKILANDRTETSLNVDGLEDFLKSSNLGSRVYGAKGQGW